MTYSVIKAAVLSVHPSTRSDAVRSLGAQVRAEEPGIVVFQYSLEADMSSVTVPLPRVGQRTEDLWKHTCFEAFIAPADEAGYYEFNFSPSLDWAIYRFSAYREGMSAAEIDRAPKISVHRASDGLELRSSVQLANVAGLREVRHLRIALAAVIEDEHCGLSYWALRHPPGQADFHHPSGFALEIACS